MDQIRFKVNSAYQHGGDITAGVDTLLDLEAKTPLSSSQTIYFTIDGTDPMMADGTVNPSAIAYDGSEIPLFDTTYVRARVRTVGSTDSWSAVVEATYLANDLATSSNIAVTEVMYHPADPETTGPESAFSDDDDFEYIELQNVSQTPVDLVGLEFTQGIRFKFEAESLFANASGEEVNPLVLGAGESLVVVKKRDAFEARYSDDISEYGVRIAGNFIGEHKLSNGGERVRLINVDKQQITDFEYDDDINSTDGDGNALHAIVVGSYDASNWEARESGGSPGYLDGVGPRVDSVTILSAGTAGHSHVIEDGPDQLRAVPVGFPSIVELSFDQIMQASSIDPADLKLHKLGTSESFTPVSVVVDASGTSVTWTFGTNITAGYYQIAEKILR